MTDTLITDLPDTDFRHPRRRVRLDTILRLRWLAALGQLAAIFIVVQGLEFDLPVVPCLVVVSASALLNLALQIAFNPMQLLEPRHAGALLALNIVELCALLYLTGGLENPFSFMFLVPVLIAATALPVRLTIGLGLLAMACTTALFFFHLPLPWDGEESLILPPIYLLGVWLSIALAIGVTGLYAFQVTEEARKLADALAATELVLAREQHLSQLDGLAAAAAHELGTPLATITLVAQELDRVVPKDGPMAEDVALLRDEVRRCRGILSKLTTLSQTAAGPWALMSLHHLLEEVISPQRAFDVRIETKLDGKGPEPSTRRNPGVIYGLGNLLDNALGFALKTVIVEAAWTDFSVTVRIKDDGKGFPPDILSRVGEPYLTTRGGDTEELEAGSGLGLGLFIAKTLLERSGATISASNLAQGGAMLTVAWPRHIFEVVEARPKPGPSSLTDVPPLVPPMERRHITDSSIPPEAVKGDATDVNFPRDNADLGTIREDVADRR
ncbi:MAG: ActS/PrrB/RegB family redox-sensitive histidine kinase [Hyphomicrobiales bacterium]|nr:ActS/PrrB/RegB family redox-sensitive histidine kinase [Hyphomicrobiales bacterium]